jgi:hypothetical protein
MPETSTPNRIARILVVLAALGLMSVGLLWRSRQISEQADLTQQQRRSQQRDALLAELRERPLLATTPTGYRAASLETVEKYIAKARAEGLDLAEIYRDRSAGEERVDVAYMLALGQPETYLDLVKRRFPDVSEREVILWLHLVDVAGHDDRLPAGLADRLKKRLMEAPHAPARWYAARQYYDGGADEAGDRIALKLLDSNSTYYKAQAARQLAKRDPHRPAAATALWEMADSDDPFARREAARALAQVMGLTDHPAYRAFRVAENAQNTADLIEVLGENRNGQ